MASSGYKLPPCAPQTAPDSLARGGHTEALSESWNGPAALPTSQGQHLIPLIVDGKPSLNLGGELGNSSAGTAAHADAILPRFMRLHLNPVLTPLQEVHEYLIRASLCVRSPVFRIAYGATSHGRQGVSNHFRRNAFHAHSAHEMARTLSETERRGLMFDWGMGSGGEESVPIDFSTTGVSRDQEIFEDMTGKSDTILVTGGAGFIGSNFVLRWIEEAGTKVVNLDLLTYAGNPANLAVLRDDSRHLLVRGDICDEQLVASLLREHQPRAIVHFAAESHVDRSIVDPGAFVRTNVQGSFSLLAQAKHYWSELEAVEKKNFRFLHVSTDEVYGSLDASTPAFSETTPYAPNSPYAASKAASDHLVRAYHHTYGLPVLTTNCSNNYGRFQFPEKLIPLMILNALEGKPLPVYGDGSNVRDWLFVEDHCAAIRTVLDRGRPGETYNIGGKSERRNLDVVAAICELVDELRPDPTLTPRRNLIKFVADRPGHDRRYAIDASKLSTEIGWNPESQFEDGLRMTVEWYLNNMSWVESVRSGAYRDWIRKNYDERGQQ